MTVSTMTETVGAVVAPTAAVTPPPLRLRPVDQRSRAVRGLSEPNLPRLYPQHARVGRWPLILSLRQAVAEGAESAMPLWGFLSASSVRQVESRRHELEARRFWQDWKSGIDSANDEHVASVFGLKARDIYDARLSRQALVDVLGRLSNGDSEALGCVDAEESPGVEETAGNLRTLALTTGLAELSRQQTAVLSLALDCHARLLHDAGMEPPHKPTACVLEDTGSAAA